MIRERAAATRRSSPSGTSRGRIPKRSRSARGASELLDGLLGSSILGFHTQFHCNNFLDTVDRQLEARVDRETFAVSYRGQRTLGASAIPSRSSGRPPRRCDAHPVDECRAAWCASVSACRADQAIGIGVDRLDYTKGIEERFRAVERLLELHPEWVGRFTFVQIAAPTREQHRASTSDYADARARARRAHQRSASPTAAHPPIILRVEHHEPRRRCTSTTARPTSASSAACTTA